MRTLTVSEYLDELQDGYEVSEAIDEGYYHDTANGPLMRYVEQMAEQDGVTLLDLENLDSETWAAYTVAEKGLS